MNSEFIFTDNFISAANKNFDVVLFESTFSDKDSDFLGAVAYHTRQENKLLIVISKTPVDTLFPLIQSGKSRTTLVNPSCGIAGFSSKGFWDMWDIVKARDFGLNIIEPLYQEEIIDIFESNQSSIYIRINEHTPWKEQVPEIKLDKNSFANFQKQGYSGSQGTILCFGSILVDSLYGAGYLQEQGHSMDVFASSNPFFKIQDDFKDSLRRTENLILIIDQHLGSLYEIWLMATLYEAGLNDISVKIIAPYYHNVSSVSAEYMYEQAKIDGFGISQRIMGK